MLRRRHSKVVENLHIHAIKVTKQVEAKRGGVINPKITIAINFNTENLDVLKKRWELITELGYTCPRGLSGTPAVILAN